MKRPILKLFLVGCGTLLILGVAAVVWISVRLGASADEVELTAHHPFRSAAARERYYERYEERSKLWPIPAESRMVETSYGRTFVRVSGPAGALPLVLLPGGQTNSLMWVPNIEAISGSFRTYALDNIYDFGRSVYTRPFRSADDFAGWLDELFTELGLGDEIRLMGISYGGWLTAEYATRHPQRLDRIVLLAPAATVLPFDREFMQRAGLTLLPHPYFMKRLMYWMMEDTVKSGDSGRRLMDDALEDIQLGVSSFKFKPMINPTVLTDEQLAGLDVPALFLVGENEKIYSATEALERLDRVAPQIHAEVIPNAGHDLTLVQADLVNKRVVSFLSAQ